MITMKENMSRRDSSRSPRIQRFHYLVAVGIFGSIAGGCATEGRVIRGVGNDSGLAKGSRANALPPMPALASNPRPKPAIPPMIARPTDDAPSSSPKRVEEPGVILAAQSPEGSSDGKPAQDPPNPPASQPEPPADNATDLAGATPPSIPQATPPQPIDLPSALRLADNQNPRIGEARTFILAALAQRQAAYAILLPTFNAGGNYHDHVGVLQRSNGTILPVTEQSLYFGGGARTVAAESVTIPAVNIFSPLTDAIFEPLAAQQRVRGSRSNAAASANTVLLEVARLYVGLLGAQAIYEARKVTAVESDQIAASVLAFAVSGQGRRSDANRADADRRLFQTDILRAEERIAVTSAQLSERLNLDPSSRLQPMSAAIQPVELIRPDVPVEELIRTAIARRPDLETARAVVAEAEFQVRKEKGRPLLPTVWLGFSGGAFGGGSNLVPPTLSAFAGRTDFDVRAYWTLLNFGAGNAALIKQRKAQAGQADAERVRVLNEVRSQVTASRSLALSLRNRVETAQARLGTAEDGYKEDRARLRETLAKPIEALDSLRLLAEARVALIEAITEYNQNQFDLFVALGSPPPL